ncbi:MAG TPA: hypothetical protein PLV68_19725, partial [Ilumatobacteraceae bacterium]|nr:hypothetical protein [Ilumatobacteraceae bacterium]
MIRRLVALAILVAVIVGLVAGVRSLLGDSSEAKGDTPSSLTSTPQTPDTSGSGTSGSGTSGSDTPSSTDAASVTNPPAV